MFEWFLIGGGLLLIMIAIIFALPGLGIGLAFPFLGDIIDIPLAFIFGTVGLIMITLGLILGGVAYFLSNFWWVIIVVLVVWFIIILLLDFAKKKLKR